MLGRWFLQNRDDIRPEISKPLAAKRQNPQEFKDYHRPQHCRLRRGLHEANLFEIQARLPRKAANGTQAIHSIKSREDVFLSAALEKISHFDAQRMWQ